MSEHRSSGQRAAVSDPRSLDLAWHGRGPAPPLDRARPALEGPSGPRCGQGDRGTGGQGEQDQATAEPDAPVTAVAVVDRPGATGGRVAATRRSSRGANASVAPMRPGLRAPGECAVQGMRAPSGHQPRPPADETSSGRQRESRPQASLPVGEHFDRTAGCGPWTTRHPCGGVRGPAPVVRRLLRSGYGCSTAAARE